MWGVKRDCPEQITLARFEKLNLLFNILHQSSCGFICIKCVALMSYFTWSINQRKQITVIHWPHLFSFECTLDYRSHMFHEMSLYRKHWQNQKFLMKDKMKTEKWEGKTQPQARILRRETKGTPWEKNCFFPLLHLQLLSVLGSAPPLHSTQASECK